MNGNTPKPEIEGVEIVALGSFNPAIFQPLWFSNNALVRKEEAEQAKMEIVHPQATIFSADWFSLRVTQEVFSVDTSDPTKVLPLRDLVSGTFKILEHTPIRFFGFNRYMHFQVESEESWHAFGHQVAPKDVWNDLLVRPGLRSLTIQGKRENCEAEFVQLKVEPSVKYQPGIFIHTNQHYKLAGSDEIMTKAHMGRFLKMLQDSWSDFLSYSERVPQHLFSRYLKPRS